MSDAERIAELEAEVKKLKDRVWDLEINIREMQQGAQRVLGAVSNYVLGFTHTKPTA